MIVERLRLRSLGRLRRMSGDAGTLFDVTAGRNEPCNQYTSDGNRAQIMETFTKIYPTPNGPVEGIQTHWPGFGILMVTGSKGFLACPAFDIDACQRYGAAAAIVESTPQNPIGTLDRFASRKIIKANEKARALGIHEGMEAVEAFDLIA